MKLLVKVLGTCVLSICFICCNSNSADVKKPSDKDEVVLLEPDDSVLDKYKDTAQAEMDYLIEFMAKQNKADTMYEYFVKSKYMDNSKNEHMWSQVFEHKNHYFIGVLANDPQFVKNILNGDSVKVYDKDVEDWILKDYLTNTEVGGFSQEYLKSKGR